MQLAAFDIKPAHFGRAPRDDDRAIIILGQALQPRASVHSIANGGDDPTVCLPASVRDDLDPSDFHAVVDGIQLALPWRRKRIRSFNSAKLFRVVISSRLEAIRHMITRRLRALSLPLLPPTKETN